MEEYIDKEKAIRMLLKIIDKERENLKTKNTKIEIWWRN